MEKYESRVPAAGMMLRYASAITSVILLGSTNAVVRAGAKELPEGERGRRYSVA